MAKVKHQRRISRFVRRVAPGVDNLSHYQIAWLPSDIAAGLSVAAVALPVGIAYADLAGVPAVIGMYAAIFPLFAYALFGSSRQLMVGPDAATCMMMAAALGPLAAGDPERYLALVIVMTLTVGLVYLLNEVSCWQSRTESMPRPDCSKKTWLDTQWELTEQQNYPTLTSAVKAFKSRDNRPGTATSG